MALAGFAADYYHQRSLEGINEGQAVGLKAEVDSNPLHSRLSPNAPP